MPRTMTVLFGGTGPDWEYREAPVPDPGPGQVLVRTGAVAFNNADTAMLDAADQYVAGFEFAGEIVAVGEGVRGPAVGERVMGTTPRSFAQYVLADHRHVLLVPDGVGYEEAAALPTGLLTEHGALSPGSFQAGQSVLITAASSGIGLIGVRIAKAIGAGMVIATTRSVAKRELLTRTGADVVVVTDEQDLTQAVLEATGQDGVDVVLDHVGGQTFADCLPATRVDGHVVNIGRLGQARSTIDLDALSYRHLRLRGVSFGFTRAAELGAVIAELTPQVLPAVADGRIRPVDTTLPFDQANTAAARLRTHQAHGKVVVSMP
ncbi:zinc-binding alcohol dehydrogenase family protein [Streptomyces sp. NPDC056721]|uniref:quinone oxidoreductase family protein n=1 Tax=Streptomyces sp. NPDC056721 TaxID=3345923 RepID=UPI0036BF371B